MSTNPSQPNWKIESYTPKHETWPYSGRDFSRQDERPDTEFYNAPKYVTHIDDNAIEQLSVYYDSVLPTNGRVLDFCSSWISHYPDRVGNADVQVYGMGLNQAELDRNPLFGSGEGKRLVVQDLNVNPDVSTAFPADVKFDASTCTVSIDYLSKPLEVLTSLRTKTIPGGSVHLAISNRAFWHKVVRRWMQVDERGRLEMVADYLWFAGWRQVEIVTVVEKKEASGMMSMFGGGTDPIWVVRGRNIAEGGN